MRERIPNAIQCLSDKLAAGATHGGAHMAAMPVRHESCMQSRAQRGMPQLRRPDRRGALRVVVNVVIPRRLTEEQRKLNEQFAQSLTDENLAAPEGLGAKLRRLLSSSR